MKILLLSVILISFISCGPRLHCQTNQINPVFIGFTRAEIDTIVIRKYTANGDFAELLDTVLIDMTDTTQYAYRYTAHHDSTIFSIYMFDSTTFAIVPGYDWRIYIPSRNKTISISGIENGAHIGDPLCPDPIASFQQDKLPIMTPEYIADDVVGYDWWLLGYRAYIHP